MREFSVFFRCGRFTAWLSSEADCRHDALKEPCGIIEAGGNIWEESPDGFLPDGEGDYEVVAIEEDRYPETIAFLNALSQEAMAA